MKPIRIFCTVLLLLLQLPSGPAFAVQVKRQIALPAGKVFAETNVTLTLPSGTEQNLSAKDRGASGMAIPVSDQPGQADLDLDLNGDGLYHVIDQQSGTTLAVIPVNNDQVIEIGDNPGSSNPVDATVTAQNKTGQAVRATVTLTGVSGPENQRQNYTGNAGANGKASFSGVRPGLYWVSVGYTGADGKTHIVSRYQYIGANSTSHTVNVDDAGNLVNQLLALDQFFRQTNNKAGLQAVRQQLAALKGLHIVDALPPSARDLVSGFRARLDAATTVKDKLKVIKDARAKLQDKVKKYGDFIDQKAVQGLNQALDQLEKFFQSPQYDPKIQGQIKKAEQTIEQRDGQTAETTTSTSTAQLSTEVTRQLEQQRQAGPDVPTKVVQYYDIDSGKLMGLSPANTEYGPVTLSQVGRWVVTSAFFSGTSSSQGTAKGKKVAKKKAKKKKATKKKARKKQAKKKKARKKARKKAKKKNPAVKKGGKTTTALAGNQSDYFNSSYLGRGTGLIIQYSPDRANFDGVRFGGRYNSADAVRTRLQYYQLVTTFNAGLLQDYFTPGALRRLHNDDSFWNDVSYTEWDWYLFPDYCEFCGYYDDYPWSPTADHFLDLLEDGDFDELKKLLQDDRFVRALARDREFMDLIFPPPVIFVSAGTTEPGVPDISGLTRKYYTLGDIKFQYQAYFGPTGNFVPNDLVLDTLKVNTQYQFDTHAQSGTFNSVKADDYGLARSRLQFNGFTGAKLDLNWGLDFYYTSNTDQLTEQQRNAIQYKGSNSGVSVGFNNFQIGKFYAGSLNYSVENAGPNIDPHDLPPNWKFSALMQSQLDGFQTSVPAEIKAAAGARGKPVADPPVQAKKLPNDGFFYSKGSWGQDYDDQWGLKRIGFTTSGRDGKGSLWPKQGEPVMVAVVDTGIDFGHPELAGTIAINDQDDPNNDQDDDDNRFKNDFLGWNFVSDGNNTFDDNGHGTFVAGIIAARIDNGIGMAGINPWARILPVKVADMFGRSNDVDVAQGIAYAARRGAKVINVSIGGRTLSKIEQAAIDEAVQRGALVVVAAGNENEDLKDLSPAGLAGVITVTATDQKDKRTAYSNWGAKADIAAPGEEILSLRAIQTDLLQFFDKDYKPGSNILGTHRQYYRLSGTSFAAPYVAGVASLLLSLRPELTPAQVRRMILQSAKDIEVPGIDQFTGYGLLDAAAALKADPNFFVEARINGVSVVQVDGQPHLQIDGIVNANQFKRAWIEIGAGENPQEWEKVAGDFTTPAKSGALARIAARKFAGAKTWVLKLVTEHKNGNQRENRFVLKVG